MKYFLYKKNILTINHLSLFILSILMFQIFNWRSLSIYLFKLTSPNIIAQKNFFMIDWLQFKILTFF